MSVLFSFFGTGLCVHVMALIHIHMHMHVQIRIRIHIHIHNNIRIHIHIHIHNNDINSSTLLAFSIGYSEVLVEVSYCRQFRLKPRVQSLMERYIMIHLLDRETTLFSYFGFEDNSLYWEWDTDSIRMCW